MERIGNMRKRSVIKRDLLKNELPAAIVVMVAAAAAEVQRPGELRQPRTSPGQACAATNERSLRGQSLLLLQTPPPARKDRKSVKRSDRSIRMRCDRSVRVSRTAQPSMLTGARV